MRKVILVLVLVLFLCTSLFAGINENAYAIHKEPSFAWYLSFSLPAGDQFYNGAIGRGILFDGLYTISILATIIPLFLLLTITTRHNNKCH